MELLLFLIIIVVIVLAAFGLKKPTSSLSSPIQQINESSSNEYNSATKSDLYADDYIEEFQWSRLEREAKSEYHSRKEELKALEKSIGIKDQNCPNCQAPLAKMPKRKSKCKSCGEPIFPRTLPNDNKPRLYSEATHILFEEVCAYQAEEWIKWRTYRLHDEFTNKKNDTIRLTLAEEWNVSPDTISEGDITWREHHHALAEAIEKGDDVGAYAANESILRQLHSEFKYDKMIPVISQCLFFHHRVWDSGSNLSPIVCKMITTAMKAMCLKELELRQKVDAHLSILISDSKKRAVLLGQIREDISSS